EHLASRGFCFIDTGPINGSDHVDWHAAYGFGVMDVYGLGLADARTLHHPGARAPCRVAKRTKGAYAMSWSSPVEFFTMGGYGTYVWGSLGATIAAICVEWTLLRQRR